MCHAQCEYMPAGGSGSESYAPPGPSLAKTAAQVRQRLREDGSYDFDVGHGRRAYARVRSGVCFGALAVGGARPATVPRPVHTLIAPGGAPDSVSARASS